METKLKNIQVRNCVSFYRNIVFYINKLSALLERIVCMIN